MLSGSGLLGRAYPGCWQCSVHGLCSKQVSGMFIGTCLGRYVRIDTVACILQRHFLRVLDWPAALATNG